MARHTYSPNRMGVEGRKIFFINGLSLEDSIDEG